MLVLSRKLNEKIVIDGGIVLTVVKVDSEPGRPHRDRSCRPHVPGLPRRKSPLGGKRTPSPEAVGRRGTDLR